MTVDQLKTFGIKHRKALSLWALWLASVLVVASMCSGGGGGLASVKDLPDAADGSSDVLDFSEIEEPRSSDSTVGRPSPPVEQEFRDSGVNTRYPNTVAGYLCTHFDQNMLTVDSAQEMVDYIQDREPGTTGMEAGQIIGYAVEKVCPNHRWDLETVAEIMVKNGW